MLFGARKRYLIKKDIQARFMLRFVAAATAWAVVAALSFAWLAGKRLDDLRYSSHIDVETTRELLLPVTLGAHGAALLIFAGILAYTIRSLWRRLSPPLAVITKNIATIAAGDLTHPVVLRRKDEFQDLAGNIEEMRQGLRERIVALKERQRALAVAADALRASIEGGNPSPLHAAALASAVEQMKEAVHAFHLEPERERMSRD